MDQVETWRALRAQRNERLQSIAAEFDGRLSLADRRVPELAKLCSPRDGIDLAAECPVELRALIARNAGDELWLEQMAYPTPGEYLQWLRTPNDQLMQMMEASPALQAFRARRQIVELTHSEWVNGDSGQLTPERMAAFMADTTRRAASRARQAANAELNRLIDSGNVYAMLERIKLAEDRSNTVLLHGHVNARTLIALLKLVGDPYADEYRLTFLQGESLSEPPMIRASTDEFLAHFTQRLIATGGYQALMAQVAEAGRRKAPGKG